MPRKRSGASFQRNYDRFARGVKEVVDSRQMQKELGFTVVEGSQPIEQAQAPLRHVIMQLL